MPQSTEELLAQIRGGQTQSTDDLLKQIRTGPEFIPDTGAPGGTWINAESPEVQIRDKAHAEAVQEAMKVLPGTPTAINPLFEKPATPEQLKALEAQAHQRFRAEGQPAVEQAITTGLRTVPAIAGQILGGVVGGAGGATVGAPTGPGAVATGAAGALAGSRLGGAVGGGLGEVGAQVVEQYLGDRPEGFNPALVGTNALVSALIPRALMPVPGLKNMILQGALKRGAFGGVMGGAQTEAVGLLSPRTAEEGIFPRSFKEAWERQPSAKQLALGTGLGVAAGGVLGAGEGAWMTRGMARAAAKAKADVAAKEVADLAAARLKYTSEGFTPEQRAAMGWETELPIRKPPGTPEIPVNPAGHPINPTILEEPAPSLAGRMLGQGTEVGPGAAAVGGTLPARFSTQPEGVVVPRIAPQEPLGATVGPRVQQPQARAITEPPPDVVGARALPEAYRTPTSEITYGLPTPEPKRPWWEPTPEPRSHTVFGAPEKAPAAPRYEFTGLRSEPLPKGTVVKVGGANAQRRGIVVEFNEETGKYAISFGKRGIAEVDPTFVHAGKGKAKVPKILEGESQIPEAARAHLEGTAPLTPAQEAVRAEAARVAAETATPAGATPGAFRRIRPPKGPRLAPTPEQLANTPTRIGTAELTDEERAVIAARMARNAADEAAQRGAANIKEAQAVAAEGEGPSTLGRGPTPVGPQNIRQVINSIPQTGDIEFDHAVAALKALRNKAGREGLSDAELKIFGEMADNIRSHPLMPAELNEAWDRIGKANLARGPKFKPGDRVVIKAQQPPHEPVGAPPRPAPTLKPIGEEPFVPSAVQKGKNWIARVRDKNGAIISEEIGFQTEEGAFKRAQELMGPKKGPEPALGIEPPRLLAGGPTAGQRKAPAGTRYEMVYPNGERFYYRPDELNHAIMRAEREAQFGKGPTIWDHVRNQRVAYKGSPSPAEAVPIAPPKPAPKAVAAKPQTTTAKLPAQVTDPKGRVWDVVAESPDGGVVLKSGPNTYYSNRAEIATWRTPAEQQAPRLRAPEAPKLATKPVDLYRVELKAGGNRENWAHVINKNTGKIVKTVGPVPTPEEAQKLAQQHINSIVPRLKSETGSIKANLLNKVTIGGVGGAATGYQFGETEREKRRNAIVGGFLGAAVGMGIPGRRPAQLPPLNARQAALSAAEKAALREGAPTLGDRMKNVTRFLFTPKENQSLGKAAELTTNWHARIDRDPRVEAAIKSGHLPAEARPENTLDPILSGRMGWAENAAIGAENTMHEAQQLGLTTRLEEYLRLMGFGHGLDTLELKAAMSQALSHDEFVGAATRYAERKKSQMILEKIAAGKALPEGYDRALVDADMAQLKASLTPEQYAHVKRLGQQIFDINWEALKMLEKSGVYNKHLVSLLEQNKDNYIPLQRILNISLADEKIRALSRTAGRPLSVKTAGIFAKALEGSELKTVHPVYASLDRYVQAVKLCARNDAAKAVTQDLLREAPELKGIIRPLAEGEAPKVGEGAISTLVDGNRHVYAVPDFWASAMATADMPITPASATLTGRYMGLYRNLLQTSATVMNPAFTITNPLRDVMDAFIFGLTGAGGQRWKLRELPMFIEKWMKNAGHIYRQDAVYREGFLKSGASYAGLQKNISPEHFMQIAGQRTKPMTGLHAVEKASNIFEEATKMTALEMNLQHGMSRPAAIAATRRFGGSPDFGRRGTIATEANLLMMFANAQMQGIVRNFSAMKQNPGRMALAAAAMTALAGMQYAYNSNFYDSDGTRSIDRLSDNDRQNYFVLFTGGMYDDNGIKRHESLKISMGHLARILFNLGRGVVETGMAAQEGRDTNLPAKRATEALVSNLLPGNVNLKMEKPVASIAAGLGSSLNPAVKVPIEQLANYNLGSMNKIVPESVGAGKPEHAYTSDTSPFARAITPRWISPMRTEHTIKGMTGGLGEMGLSLADLPFKIASGKQRRVGAAEGSSFFELPQTPVFGPIFRRFVGSTVNQEMRDMTEKIYDKYKEAGMINRDIRRRFGIDPNEALTEDLPGLTLADKRAIRAFGQLSKLITDLGRLRTMRERIENTRPANAEKLMEMIAEKERIGVKRGAMAVDFLNQEEKQTALDKRRASW